MENAFEMEDAFELSALSEKQNFSYSELLSLKKLSE